MLSALIGHQVSFNTKVHTEPSGLAVWGGRATSRLASSAQKQGGENWKGSVVHDSGLFHLGQGQQACMVNMRNKFQLEGIAIWFEDQARTFLKFIHAHKAKLSHCELVPREKRISARSRNSAKQFTVAVEADLIVTQQFASDLRGPAGH